MKNYFSVVKHACRLSTEFRQGRFLLGIWLKIFLSLSLSIPQSLFTRISFIISFEGQTLFGRSFVVHSAHQRQGLTAPEEVELL